MILVILTVLVILIALIIIKQVKIKKIPRIKHSETATALPMKNIIAEAKKEVVIFTGFLGEGFDGPDIFSEAVSQALKRGVNFTVMFGPLMDKHAASFLTVLLCYPKQVQIQFLRLMYATDGGNQWLTHHFVVADKDHVGHENRHPVLEPDRTPHGWSECYNDTDYARIKLATFSDFKDVSVTLDVSSPAAFFASFEAAGGRYYLMNHEASDHFKSIVARHFDVEEAA